MSVLLVVASFVTVAGALVAISGRDARIALAGLLVALVAAPFLADPPPEPAALGVRVVAALLGGYLLFMTLRDTSAATRGSLAGLPAETLAAAAAYVIGYGTSGLGSAPLGPTEASAAGFALAVISVAPIVRGADVFRLGVALAILVTGAELVRVGLAGTPSPLEQLVTSGLTVGLLGTVAVLCANTVAATGGLALRNEPRRSALFEAHPITPTAPSSLRSSFLPAWRPRRRKPDAGPARPSDAHRMEPSTPRPAADAPGRAARSARRAPRTDEPTTEDATAEQLPLALGASARPAKPSETAAMEPPDSEATTPVQEPPEVAAKTTTPTEPPDPEVSGEPSEPSEPTGADGASTP